VTHDTQEISAVVGLLPCRLILQTTRAAWVFLPVLFRYCGSRWRIHIVLLPSVESEMGCYSWQGVSPHPHVVSHLRYVQLQTK
jgi:hypothetical protein